MKKKIPFIGLVTGITLLICSCSTTSNPRNGVVIASRDIPKETIQVTENYVSPNPEEKLPTGFTKVNIKSSLEEYINYRLWFYPEKVQGNYSAKSFDPYIGQTIDIEVRLYSDISGKKKVYAHTSIGEWLAIFEIKNGIVYCDGQVSKDENLWPQDKFEVIETFSVEVKQPHKPNYGTSSRKDRMIAALETKLKALCEDFTRGSDAEKWSNAMVYIEDFYEYESGGGAWFVRQDGYAWYSPVHLVEKNNDFEAEGMKGFGLKNINSLDKYDPGRDNFEKHIHDAVKQFTCKSNVKPGE
ncbi:hypothetical protein [Paenibacillus eucommiae]|uniref:Lipoprotein n=1 Tax=Paenibacillus eucommiae TaxID=1355755 RepID=A0ABS4IZP0_9BACL|nr:hypothetical protein [Paenibacillus eucommiae]MBP1993028.1 hypothetical protein [Paenibacillus eucommiae]